MLCPPNWMGATRADRPGNAFELDGRQAPNPCWAPTEKGGVVSSASVHRCRTTRLRRRISVAGMVLLPPLTACGTAGADRARVDSLQQASRHAEHVIDSVASTIDTDSLYHTYRAMLNAPHPEQLVALTDCIGERLIWRYGMYPADHAIQRMLDTLWNGVEDQARAMRDRWPPYGLAVVTDSTCGPLGPRGPLLVEGVALDPLAKVGGSPRPQPPARR